MIPKRSRRRWYAIGAVFAPYQVEIIDGKEIVGCQVLAIQDIESQRFLDKWLARRRPAPFSAQEILDFLDRVFKESGKPKRGLLVLPSVWRSFGATYHDSPACEALETIHQLGFDWPEMQEAERLKLALKLQALGLTVEWSEEEIPPSAYY